MDMQKTPNSWSSLEKENGKEGIGLQPQAVLQSCGNQNTMVLAQKQKYRSMEQDRKPGDKPTHLMVNLPLTTETRIYSGGRIVTSISDSRKTGQLHVKEWN